jgi:DNA mismatch repair protein MSH4
MMIDPSTIYSLELIQNLHNPMSTDCLFGLLNQTLTPMGSRLLRSNILQPLTETETLEARLDALEELTTNEEMFFSTRQGRPSLLAGGIETCVLERYIDFIFPALKPFLDMDRLLTAVSVIHSYDRVGNADSCSSSRFPLKHHFSFQNSL